MTFFFDTRDAATAINPVFSPGPKTGFVDNFLAGRHFQKTTENLASDRQALADAYDDVVDAIRAESDAPNVANPYRVGGSVRLQRGDERRLFTEGELQANLWELIADARAGNPDAYSGLPDSHDNLLERISENARQAEKDAQDTGARATLMGRAGQFLGHAEGWMEDPLQGPTVLAGAPVRAGILATAGIEALLATSIEIPVQVRVQAYRKRLGLESGFRRGAENVAMAAGGAAVFGAGVKSILPAARLSARAGQVAAHEMRELLKTFDGLIQKPVGEQAAVRAAIEREAEIGETNPLSGEADKTGEHRGRLDAAIAAADDLSTPDISERPVARPSPEINTDGLLQPFRPEDLEVDAGLFQFKSGGDAHGVTERLRGVSRWDPVKSNLLVVYERADGRRLVVDGHQRYGLARRIRFNDPEQDPVLYGFTLREADGVTPEEVRVIAALKNIGEGSGTAVDAARVLRADPRKLTDLPPKSALVQQAGDMVQLADDVFGLVSNDILPAGYGALIGRLIPDDYGMQRAVAKVILDTDPDNLVQAESIIRQAMDAGTHTEVQDSLFGPEVLTRSLFSERAKVLDKSIKGLRRDTRIFNTVVKNETDLAAAGNVLATDRNAARAATDEKTIKILTSIANRKGPLSDALTAAAAQFAKTGRIGPAVRDFPPLSETRLNAAISTGIALASLGALRMLQMKMHRQEALGPTEPARR